MVNPVSGLKLDYWYKVLVVVGAAGAIAAMTVELKGIANAHALIFSVGCFCVGMGEWINHPLQTVIVAPSAQLPTYGQITGHPRKNTWLGNAFDIVGFVALTAAIYKIAQAG